MTLSRKGFGYFGFDDYSAFGTHAPAGPATVETRSKSASVGDMVTPTLAVVSVATVG